MNEKLVRTTRESVTTVTVEFECPSMHGPEEIEGWAIAAAKVAWHPQPFEVEPVVRYCGSTIEKFNVGEYGLSQVRQAVVEFIWPI